MLIGNSMKESLTLQEAAVLCLEHLSDVPAHAAAILEHVSLRHWVQLLRESSSTAVRKAVPGMLQRVLFGSNAAEVNSNDALSTHCHCSCPRA